VAIALLALAGAVVSARLAAYQLRWAGPPWEPFFGGGSRHVLAWDFSRALHLPGAAVGVVAYVAEIAAVAWGGPERYRNRRVAVFASAAIAAALALGSAGLVFLQTAVLHALCTLCLLSAIISFVLLVPTWTEFAAALRGRGPEHHGNDGARLETVGTLEGLAALRPALRTKP
jgi:hypothetical protein